MLWRCGDQCLIPGTVWSSPNVLFCKQHLLMQEEAPGLGCAALALGMCRQRDSFLTNLLFACLKFVLYSFLEMKTLGLVGKEEVRTSKNPKKSPGEGSVLCYLISYEIIPSTVLFTCPQLTPLCSKTTVIDSYEIGELACHVSTHYGEGPFALLSFCSSWSVWTGLHFFWDSQLYTRTQ